MFEIIHQAVPINNSEIKWTRFRDEISVNQPFVDEIAEDIALKGIPDVSIHL
jgi:hypothetical protein